MSGDIESMLHSMYRGALRTVSLGVYDPDSIRLVREGVLKGYIGWREATRAGMALLETDEVSRAMECLHEVINGVNHRVTLPYILSFVKNGVLDPEEIQRAIDEGKHAVSQKLALYVRADRSSIRRKESHIRFAGD